MRVIDLLHRWMGGLIGLVLALLGVSGTLLLHADGLFRPPASGASARLALPEVVARAMPDAAHRPDYILFASPDFPFHRVVRGDGSGFYLDEGGAVASRWHSIWERPELWLFDFHRHLFSGDMGETIVGLCGIAGLIFVITGGILWWQRRRTFAPRLLPARMTRPAIVRHHRDLGILLAPLLLMVFVTGTAMALKPVGQFLVSPWSSAAEMKVATAKPGVKGGALAARPDWAALLSDAQHRFPAAEIRMLSLPRKPGDLIAVRMKQPEEWLPNGRTTLWYAPDDGHRVEARDARTLPAGARILAMTYPLHAAKVGGLAYRLVMTLCGLGLTMLGSLTVISFWAFRAK